jgi:hypothetical protein
MGDADQMLGVPTPSEVNELVGERPTLRFAVGIFDTWADVQATVRDLAVGGMAENSFQLPRPLSCARPSGGTA